MLRGGRPKDPIWEHFSAIDEGQKKFSAQCRKCLNFQSARACRMKMHHAKCSASIEQPRGCDPTETSTSNVRESRKRKNPESPLSGRPTPPAKRSHQQSIDNYVLKTPATQVQDLDRAIADFVYGCNLPVSVVESPNFKALLQALRPGYQPPTREALSSMLSPRSKDKLQAKIKPDPESKVVTIQELQDGE